MYDAFGRVVRLQDDDLKTPGGPRRTTVYTYDRVTGQETVRQVWTDGNHPGGAVGPSERLEHTHDSSTGRVSSVRTLLPGGSVGTQTDYSYDTAGRLKSATAKVLAGIMQSSPATTDTYDKTGLLLSESQPSGVISTYQYDAFGQNVGVTVTRDDLSTPGVTEATPLFEQSFTLAADGQRAGAVEKRYSGTSSTPFSTTHITWGYDALDRLVSERRDADGDASIEVTGDYLATYSLDATGNRLRKVVDDFTAAKDETVTYVYGDVGGVPAFNQATVSRNDHLRWIMTVRNGVTTFTQQQYDLNGSNITETSYDASGTITSTQKNQLDLRNRLRGFDANGDDDTADQGDAVYLYDSDGVRVEKRVVGAGGATTATRFVVDPSNPTGYAKPIEERSSTGVLPVALGSYVAGHDVLAQQGAGESAATYLVQDARGYTRLLTDATGVPITGQSFDVDAYGVRLDPNTAATAWLAPDGYTDAETGTIYQLARYTDRETGRFLSFDSFEADPSQPAGLHKFVLGNANPVYYWDPSGQLSLGQLLTSFGVTATALRIGIGSVLGIIDAHLRGYSYLHGAALGAAAGAFAPLIPFKVGVTLGGLGVIEAIVAGEYDAAVFRALTLGIGVLGQKNGFPSFKDFKGFFGRAGPGKAWHHIVEQTPNNMVRFGAQAIQTPDNIVPLPHGAGSLHNKISGSYSSRQVGLTGPGYSSVRAWLAQKSFAEQYRFGLEAIARFGGQGAPMSITATPTSWTWPATLELFEDAASSDNDE